MSVEQTSQLIQLILNSVLMILACVIGLVGLRWYLIGIGDRLRSSYLSYSEAVAHLSTLSRLSLLRNQSHELRRRYKRCHSNIHILSCALILFVASSFFLSFRGLVNYNWLMSISLICFISGLVIFLIAVLIILADLNRTQQTLWSDLNQLRWPIAPLSTVNSSKSSSTLSSALSVSPLQRSASPIAEIDERSRWQLDAVKNGGKPGQTNHRHSRRQ